MKSEIDPELRGVEIVKVVINRRTFTEKIPRVHYKVPAHGITLLVHGNAQFNQGGVDFPAARPLFWYLPADTAAWEEVDSGLLHTMYVIFRLPGLHVVPENKSSLRIDLNGNTLCVPRWKQPDADAVTYVVDLFARLKKAFETPRVGS